MVSPQSNDRNAGSASQVTAALPGSDTRGNDDRDAPPVSDGGVAWSDLTGFQRDLLKAIRRCGQDGEIPTGQTIKHYLEQEYEQDINNGRLYQNLGFLVDSDLLEKGFVDGRTNTYHLSPVAVGMLDETATRFAHICELTVAPTS